MTSLTALSRQLAQRHLHSHTTSILNLIEPADPEPHRPADMEPYSPEIPTRGLPNRTIKVNLPYQVPTPTRPYLQIPVYGTDLGYVHLNRHTLLISFLVYPGPHPLISIYCVFFFIYHFLLFCWFTNCRSVCMLPDSEYGHPDCESCSLENV